MLKKFTDIARYIFGGAVNVLIVIGLGFILYTVTIEAFKYGKTMLSEEAITNVSREVTVKIPDGADALAIGEILEKERLVSNKYIFYIQARLNGTAPLFKPGEFVLNTNMGSGNIMDTLQSVQNLKGEEVKITIVEGLTNKQIAEYVEAEGLFSADEFLKSCQEGVYNYPFLAGVPERDNRLEGYLFPDTYNLPKNPKPEDLIVRMLNRFYEVYSDTWQTRTKELGLTIDQVVIMSSIVEKEIKAKSERSMASSVIHNRLGSDMKLEMCSTVLYVLDKRKERLLDSDLLVKSPYNTYLHKGLPAGPICNAGKASIEAALYPMQSKDLYFVAKDEKTGEHFFTDNYDAFLAAKKQYNQKY